MKTVYEAQNWFQTTSFWLCECEHVRESLERTHRYVAPSFSSLSLLPSYLCVSSSQRAGKDRGKEQSVQLNASLRQSIQNSHKPKKCFYGLVGWKVVGLYEVGVHPPPTQLSGKLWMGILLGSEKEPAAGGNKCVLTSTLLSTRWFISSDDSNANSNGGILPRPPSSCLIELCRAPQTLYFM